MYTKKIILPLFVLAFAIFFPSAIWAEGLVVDPNEGIDVVLVIDTSGSMRDTDPERIALEAATLFMDMMETRHSRIGIVGFSGDVHAVMPLTSIYDASARDHVREVIGGFQYQGWTDIGLALRQGVEMILNDPAEANNPMILLFTDGRIELPDWFERDIATSYSDATWAIENSAGIVPIYTIGLNHDNTVNIAFLEDVSARTNGESFVIESAELLPELFHEIFASHIRSSIHEVATVFPDGDTFTDVVVPIPSNFVQEANIIMLSTRPITEVRLFDPLGREVAFDNRNYTLTSANRYSMIKVIEPDMGDWLLTVRGLPEDRITINLIYNYVIDVAFSVSQEGAAGGYFDPTTPVLVQAGFVSELSATQVQNLFTESTAEIYVHDMDMNLIQTIPMSYDGTHFVGEVFPSPHQDVRISISVAHPSFSQTTAVVPVTYHHIAPDPTEPTPVVAPTAEPEPEPVIEYPTEAYTEEYIPTEPTPAAEPIAAPVDTDDATNNTVVIAAALLAVLLIIIILLLMIRKKAMRKPFIGHLEVRALLKNGTYTALEAPDLSTFAGRISLKDFLNITLGARALRILQTNVPIDGTYIEPIHRGGQAGVLLITDGLCHIADIERNAIHSKKIPWQKNQRLTFSLPDGIEKIEITYRIYED